MQAEWRDIETAPKDGTRVLLFENFARMKTIGIARWVAAPHDVWIAENGSYSRHATHWMPMPSPPA